VASRAIAADPELGCGPSTVRNELALLEEHGLLAHPHTSAGRVPTDAGQRYVVDLLLAPGDRPTRAPGDRLTRLAPAPRLELSLVRREVEEAMRATTEALAEVTNLLAVVSAPPLQAATVRHIEVLALQPQVVMVVIITSTGGVSKTLVTFDRPVDPGLIGWAGEYLNERLCGVDLGSRILPQRLLDSALDTTERSFVEQLAPAFREEPASEALQTLYVEGASHLLSAGQLGDATEINELMSLLERRVALLTVLREALAAPDVYVRIGEENEMPAMRSLAMVGAGYGLGPRRLGAVSVIGPVRMDYPGAIATVREAARELSRFVEDTYAER